MGLLVNPDYPNTEHKVPALREAARATGIDMQIVEASTGDQIDAAFDALARVRAGALVVDGDPFLAN